MIRDRDPELKVVAPVGAAAQNRSRSTSICRGSSGRNSGSRAAEARSVAASQAAASSATKLIKS